MARYTKMQRYVASAELSSTLTAAQFFVAARVADEMSNRAIADSLGISENTVKRQMLLISEKLQVRSRVGVAMWVVRNFYEKKNELKLERYSDLEYLRRLGR